jgi:hypothetical protein
MTDIPPSLSLRDISPSGGEIRLPPPVGEGWGEGGVSRSQRWTAASTWTREVRESSREGGNCPRMDAM